MKIVTKIAAILVVIVGSSTAFARNWVAYVPGCLAEGTMIATAGNSKLAVEKIRTLQFVKSPRNSERALVTSTSASLYKSTMVSVTDSLGNTLKATSSHPIWIASQGFIEMESVKVNDEIQTMNGPARVVAVSKTSGAMVKVYNLITNFAEETPDALGKDASMHSVFANNILVGDLFMQNVLAGSKN